jgi:hypothetical protein
VPEARAPLPEGRGAFPDREAAKRWVINNQRGRRNLTPERAAYYRGLIYLAEKQSPTGRPASKGTEASGLPQGPGEAGGKSCHRPKTEQKLADEFKVSARTVRNDAAFAKAVDTVAQNCGPGARQQILSGDSPLTRQEVIALADKDPEEQRRALNEAAASGKQKARAARAKTPEAPLPAKTGGATAPTGTGQETIMVPKEPQACAESLVLQLGREAAAKVQQALARLLGSQAVEPEAGRPKGRRRRPVKAS